MLLFKYYFIIAHQYCELVRFSIIMLRYNNLYRSHLVNGGHLTALTYHFLSLFLFYTGINICFRFYDPYNGHLVMPNGSLSSLPASEAASQHSKQLRKRRT